MAAPSEKEINQLVLRALERPDDEQRAFLQSACGEDQALFEAAWSWLRAEDELGDFLEHPAAEGLDGLTGAAQGTDLRELTAGKMARHPIKTCKVGKRWIPSKSTTG